jgi:hypothetical protein
LGIMTTKEFQSQGPGCELN